MRADQQTIYNIQNNKQKIESFSELKQSNDEEAEVKDEYFDGNSVNLQ